PNESWLSCPPIRRMPKDASPSRRDMPGQPAYPANFEIVLTGRVQASRWRFWFRPAALNASNSVAPWGGAPRRCAAPCPALVRTSRRHRGDRIGGQGVDGGLGALARPKSSLASSASTATTLRLIALAYCTAIQSTPPMQEMTIRSPDGGRH
ncbi:hypothetical protein OY671_009065, partial [Metschnikowia pulcherrima]